jgi:hypothetical protein
MKMQLLRWNNANPSLGAQHQTSVFCGEWGWTSRKSSRPPVASEVFSLTSPYIEQAFALIECSVSAIAIFRQLYEQLSRFLRVKATGVVGDREVLSAVKSA